MPKGKGQRGDWDGWGALVFVPSVLVSFFPLVEAQGKEGTDLRLRGQEQIPGSAGNQGAAVHIACRKACKLLTAQGWTDRSPEVHLVGGWWSHPSLPMSPTPKPKR